MFEYYICLGAFRVFSALFLQHSYIHPDEFFQTTEIISSDIFGVEQDRPWEFNNEAPIRSVGLLYGVYGIPLCMARWIFKFYKIRWNPFNLLLVFRLITCAISFITDYSLYKICKICKIKPDRYLILLASSYVLIVFGTKTFTNSLELPLVSLLLWKVVDSMVKSEKILAAEMNIRNAYENKTSIRDKILMSRELRKLPSHHYKHCMEIGTILAVGVFNRPTFLFFSITPIFYWISRGFSYSFISFVKVFNKRFLVLVLCTMPGILLLILFDSSYFGHITSNEANFIVTPLNFIKYNIKPSNLAQHGIHFRTTHATVNIPLLFNVLTYLFIKHLNLSSLVKIVLNHHYHLLPNIHEVKTLMAANVIIPLVFLSIFPHQECRFLLPLLLPIIFITSKYFSYHLINQNRYVLTSWCFWNVIGLFFFGYMHQAGVTPMISHLFKDIKYAHNVQIIHSHMYSIPVGLLKAPKKKLSLSTKSHLNITVHDLGSSLGVNELFNTAINIINNTEHMEKPDPLIYFAVSGPLTKELESFDNFSSLSYTKTIFFPHISMESLRLYYTSITDLLYSIKHKPLTTCLMEFRDIFSLVLYKFT